MDKPKILTVDDEPLTLKTISAYLDHSGFEHREVATGSEALEQIQDYKPDYIILDLMLPGMSGQEVLKQLRHFSDAHVTVLSALGDEKDKVKLLESVLTRITASVSISLAKLFGKSPTGLYRTSIPPFVRALFKTKPLESSASTTKT